jgi:hypothetical protein
MGHPDGELRRSRRSHLGDREVGAPLEVVR